MAMHTNAKTLHLVSGILAGITLGACRHDSLIYSQDTLESRTDTKFW